VRTWVEGSGAHVHVTVDMGSELLVEFCVKVGGVRGNGNENENGHVQTRVMRWTLKHGTCVVNYRRCLKLNPSRHSTNGVGTESATDSCESHCRCVNQVAMPCDSTEMKVMTGDQQNLRVRAPRVSHQVKTVRSEMRGRPRDQTPEPML
jgi:hypothetical protein